MKREARVKEHEAETERQLEERPIQKIKEKPYITITETALFVGVSRPTIYGYLRRGELQAKRMAHYCFGLNPLQVFAVSGGVFFGTPILGYGPQ